MVVFEQDITWFVVTVRFAIGYFHLPEHCPGGVAGAFVASIRIHIIFISYSYPAGQIVMYVKAKPPFLDGFPSLLYFWNQ